jgi:two-component system, chemotaxis family, CheB/CheR fusion protein
VGLRSALQQAEESASAVRSEGLQVRSNGGFREVNLEVLRIGPQGSRNRSFLILFEDAQWRRRVEMAPRQDEPQEFEISAIDQEDSAAYVARLKQELEATREYLQSLLEQQEAANEGLQSANEEIQSSNEELQSINEELQTTKEEIQSSNEELTTVNEELAERNDELNQANNDLVNFLSSAQLVLLMLGSDLRIRWFTPQAERMLHLISTDVGRPVGDIRLPIDAPDLEQLLREVIDTASAKELEVRDRKGQWYSLRLRPYKTMDNKIDGAVVALIDVDPLKRTKDALEQANRHKDEFLAMLAHELRNPLAPLRSQLELLRSGGAGEIVLGESIDVMHRQVERLTKLVDELLDAARVSQGRIELKAEAVDMATIASSVVELISDAVRDRHLDFSVEYPAEPVYVFGDPVRLEQAITNLVNNAVKYTDPGGKVRLLLKKQDGRAIIKCSDTGIGIAKEMLPKVFNLFVQSDVSYGRDRGGLGIGLALVRQIAELHNGEVVAASAGLGQGSEFTLRLPLHEGPVETSASTTSISAPRSSTNKTLQVLIVDDNVDAARTIAILLKRLGHEVKTASTGPAALELLKEFTPDVAVLDIGLPGMDGCELAQHIRMLPGFEETPLVALTGYSQESDHRRFREAGFDEHLVKPVPLSALQTILENASLGKDP